LAAIPDARAGCPKRRKRGRFPGPLLRQLARRPRGRQDVL